jgi:hypothetical protein
LYNADVKRVVVKGLLLWVVLPTTCGYIIAERNGDDEKKRRDFFGTVNKFCLQLE